MGLRRLLPGGVQRRLRRLEQDAVDVVTALTTKRRAVARCGALTDPEIYVRPDRAPPRPSSSCEAVPPQSATESTVTFLDRDAQVIVHEGQTILEAALEAGLDLDFSCTVGGCAACALQVVAGDVVYDGPNCLSDAERASGMCLACVGRPRGHLVVESL